MQRVLTFYKLRFILHHKCPSEHALTVLLELERMHN